MATNVSSSSSSGVGVAGLLGVAFVVLKLTGVIGWSWWLVLLPFWGPAAVLIAVGLVIGVIAGVVKALDK
jgi:membrane-bound ClpP family serine protease